MAIVTSGTSTCGLIELVASSFSARHCVYLKSLSSQRQHQRPRWVKKDNDDKIYRRLDSCLVIPPPKGKKPKAIIKFLGGASIGAIPEVTYRPASEAVVLVMNEFKARL
ncbi:alpha/beta hydrolase fold protein [Tanacetum coccineum]